MTKQKKLSAQWIAKLFKGFSVYYVFKKLKKLKLLQPIIKQKKLSAQWISKLVTKSSSLTILFSKNEKKLKKGSADY